MSAAKRVGSWCDKLASVPTVGFQFPPRYISSAQLFDKLGPLLTEMSNGPKGPSITKLDPFAVEFESEAGTRVHVSPSRVSVAFQHKLRVRPTSGNAQPSIEMLSEPLPYTALVRQVAKTLKQAIRLLDPKSEMLINRVGVVTSTQVDETDCPPGVRSFLNYISKPWGAPLEDAYAITITNPLERTDKYSDRCIHQFQRGGDESDLIVTNFDWQRLYREPRSVRGMDDLLESGIESALDYFENIAEGARFNAIDNT